MTILICRVELYIRFLIKQVSQSQPVEKRIFKNWWYSSLNRQLIKSAEILWCKISRNWISKKSFFKWIEFIKPNPMKGREEANLHAVQSEALPAGISHFCNKNHVLQNWLVVKMLIIYVIEKKSCLKVIALLTGYF